ncbi:CD209 antigen-like protein C [Pelmatolapia mariae]|uniref:CD209 antigen-like protein C n=1 Tax=Pelmatolapia mariae TaxID=158779 RepID=UPI002FE4FF3D
MHVFYDDVPNTVTLGKSQWEMETVMLHKLVDNVTSERNQLQTSYKNLTTERDQLLTIFNNLTTKHDQLQASYNNWTTERDQLLTIFNNLTTKHDQLQASYNNRTTERDQLQNRSNNLVKDRDQLQERLANMTANRDDLQKQLQDYQQNWVASNGSLYQISSEQKSWEESRQNCLQKSANLIIINSQEEQNFVNQLKKHLWIGLTDSQTEGTWKWVDGTQVTKSYWNQGNKEPNGDTKENCGEIDVYNSNDSWNDAPCSIAKFWICEKRVSP